VRGTEVVSKGCEKKYVIYDVLLLTPSRGGRNPEVARRLGLPPAPRALLDLAGGHGWFVAELVRRHPALTATVLDLPGATRVGRAIMAETGMSARADARPEHSSLRRRGS
jgi:hypothetical protein